MTTKEAIEILRILLQIQYLNDLGKFCHYLKLLVGMIVWL